MTDETPHQPSRRALMGGAGLAAPSSPETADRLELLPLA